jgi:DNA uptake protein ComE-like DNA-binding protein
VGPKGAAAIIKGRPYENTVDLLDPGIVPPAVDESIRTRIIARPPL